MIPDGPYLDGTTAAQDRYDRWDRETRFAKEQTQPTLVVQRSTEPDGDRGSREADMLRRNLATANKRILQLEQQVSDIRVREVDALQQLLRALDRDDCNPSPAWHAARAAWDAAYDALTPAERDRTAWRIAIDKSRR
mgnify:CR=1 FL=1